MRDSYPISGSVLKAKSKDANWIEKLQSNPDEAINEVRNPLQWDAAVYRITVTALGIAIILSLFGGIWLSHHDKAIPEILIAIGSAAVGALAGLLAPTNGG